jgi:hypothetical protein
MSAEQNVWNCICRYNSDAASQLIRSGYTPRTAIAVLAGYKGKSRYHGHKSGRAGDAEHQGAAALRLAAIQFLVDNVGRLQGLALPASRGKDAQKEKENRDHIEELMDVINTEDNIGKMQTTLSNMDPDWRTLRGLEDAVNRRKEAKKQKFSGAKAK